MKDQCRFSAREFILLLLPVLLFIVWALLTRQDNVRENIVGRWRSSGGNIVEYAVRGDELLVSINGQRQKHFSYRFLNDRRIEFTDRRPPRMIVAALDARMRGNVLEYGNFSVRPYKVLARYERIGS